MAKITLTIEDMVGGKVKVEMSPSGGMIAKMIVSGEKTTSAHGLAIAAINAILKEQKYGENRKIILPKLLS